MRDAIGSVNIVAKASSGSVTNASICVRVNVNVNVYKHGVYASIYMSAYVHLYISYSYCYLFSAFVPQSLDKVRVKTLPCIVHETLLGNL